MPEAGAIKMMFAGISPRYDLLNRLLSLGVDRSWRRRAVARLSKAGLPPGRRALDLCCGTGDLALDLAGAGFRVTGVDFCHEMLVIGRRKAARHSPQSPELARPDASPGPGNGRPPRARPPEAPAPAGAPAPSPIAMAEADALSLPFAGGTFDAAAVAFGVRNLEDLDAGLVEFARVLRPGGRLAVLEFGRPQGALLGTMYRFYLGRFVPLPGRAVSGSAGAYAYLSSSIREFPDQATFPDRLRGAGFTEVTCENLSGGIAALYVATKP